MKTRTLQSIINEYQTLPEYTDVKISDVNTLSLFGDKPIHVACTTGVIEDIELLINNGAEINAKGEHGYTPAHQAIEQGNLEALKILVKNRADLLLENDDGVTPKELAILLERVEILNYINSLTKNN